MRYPNFLQRVSLWTTLLLSMSSGFAAHAHGGHSKDPYHQHQQVKHTEVTLQYQRARDYAQEQKKSKAPLPEKFNPQQPVLKVILQREKKSLQTRVKIKVTDAQGKAVGPAAGISPGLVLTAAGPHYVTQLPLSKGNYFVMVQFMTPEGLQRAAFSLPIS